MHWQVAGASVAGTGPGGASKLCQDQFRVQVTPGGALIAVLSDGAGSARFGGEGAAIICDRVVARLQSLDRNGAIACSRATLASVCRGVRDAIVDAREQAARSVAASEHDLADFHATIVGAALLPGHGGILFQIGDGAALAFAPDARWQLSPPANGEYADTTFFFTDPDWRRHLRFQRVAPEFDTLFLLSDGATDLALTRRGGAHEPFMSFFEPIDRFLRGASREDGEDALRATLDSPMARERTNDDKTLIWARAAPDMAESCRD